MQRKTQLKTSSLLLLAFTIGQSCRSSSSSAVVGHMLTCFRCMLGRGDRMRGSSPLLCALPLFGAANIVSMCTDLSLPYGNDAVVKNPAVKPIAAELCLLKKQGTSLIYFRMCPCSGSAPPLRKIGYSPNEVELWLDKYLDMSVYTTSCVVLLHTSVFPWTLTRLLPLQTDRQSGRGNRGCTVERWLILSRLIGLIDSFHSHSFELIIVSKCVSILTTVTDLQISCLQRWSS